MQFKNIIGQETLKQQLVEMVNQNRLSHALLFLGKEGNGALATALAFAQYILCEKTGNKSQPNLNPPASLFGDEPPVLTPDLPTGQAGSRLNKLVRITLFACLVYQ